MNEDGSMARVPQLMEFARRHNLKIATVKTSIEYRMQRESLVKAGGPKLRCPHSSEIFRPLCMKTTSTSGLIWRLSRM